MERESRNIQPEEPLERKVNLLLPLLFLKDLISFFVFKISQTVIFFAATITALGLFFGEVKSWSVRKMFWGRSSFYKTSIHFFVGIFTLVITLTGISSRLNIFSNDSKGLVLASGVIGSSDIIFQQGTAESIVPSDPNQLGFQVYKYTVEKGNTISGIAKEYNISVDTIKWANNISPFNDKLSVGQVLDIPEIDGVLYIVKKGDSISKIAKTTKGNEIDIIELNNLDTSTVLAEGQKLFVPFGSIDAPFVVSSTGKVVKKATYISGGNTAGVNIPLGTFIRPLPDSCGSWSRGFSYFHGGVDIAEKGGCWERASAAGTVIVAGWRSAGQGFMVEVDHGKGIHTRYYHGNGNYKVKEGDHVLAGQDLQFMGCTGNCSGTHLHFEIVINGTKVNPENYINKLR